MTVNETIILAILSFTYLFCLTKITKIIKKKKQFLTLGYILVFITASVWELYGTYLFFEDKNMIMYFGSGFIYGILNCFILHNAIKDSRSL